MGFDGDETSRNFPTFRASKCIMHYACKIIVHSPEIFGTFLLTDFISKTFLLPANPMEPSTCKVTNHWNFVRKNKIFLPTKKAAPNSSFFSTCSHSLQTCGFFVRAFRFGVETESLVEESQVAHLLTPKMSRRKSVGSMWWESWEILMDGSCKKYPPPF